MEHLLQRRSTMKFAVDVQESFVASTQLDRILQPTCLVMDRTAKAAAVAVAAAFFPVLAASASLLLVLLLPRRRWNVSFLEEG